MVLIFRLFEIFFMARLHHESEAVGSATKWFSENELQRTKMRFLYDPQLIRIYPTPIPGAPTGLWPTRKP